jgi:hypothetical protein
MSTNLRLQENHFGGFYVECDKLPKSQRPKQIATIHCKEHVARDLEVRRLNAPKEVNVGGEYLDHQIQKGHMAIIHHLQVKPLQEEQVHRSLKLSNPKEPKWIMVIRSRRTHINRLCTSGGSAPGERKGGELKLLKPE